MRCMRHDMEYLRNQWKTKYERLLAERLGTAEGEAKRMYATVEDDTEDDGC